MLSLKIIILLSQTTVDRSYPFFFLILKFNKMSTQAQNIDKLLSLMKILLFQKVHQFTAERRTVQLMMDPIFHKIHKLSVAGPHLYRISRKLDGIKIIPFELLFVFFISDLSFFFMPQIF